MDLLKISFLLILAIFHVHPRNTKKHPTLWQHNTRKLNSSPDDQKNCFCYPDGELPTVHQLLDTHKDGQERVVIYLYKNIGSSEIKMYTPNTEKQVLIPDIPYDSDDGLATVTTENIYTLFYNNPNRIKVYNNRFESLIPAVTNSIPIGLNIGAIENILPSNDNYLSPNNSYSGNEYNVDSNLLMSNVPNIEIGSEQQKEILPENVNVDFAKQFWTNTNYPYQNPQTYPVNSQAFTGNPQAFPDNSQALPNFPQAYPSNHQALPQAFPENSQPILDNFQPNSFVGGLDQHVVYTFKTNEGSRKVLGSQIQDLNNPTTYVTFDVWFSQQLKRFQNIYLPKDIKSIDSNILRIMVQKTFSENNIYVSAEGIITDSKGTVIDAANLELRPLLLGEKLHHQILDNVHKNIILPKNLPYLEGILVTIVSPPRILGIIPLGKIYLSESFYLGRSLDGLATVNGSKIYVNSYSNGNSASYSIPSKVPYTVTVKESYSEPIKVSTGHYAYAGGNELPISSSYSDVYTKSLPLSYPYSITNNKPQSGASEVTYWSSGPYSTVTNLPYLTSNWNPSANIQQLGNRRKLSDVKIEHHYEPPIKNIKKVKGISKKPSKEKAVLGQDVAAEPYINLNSSESGRRFPQPSMKGVMKTLLYLLDDLPSRRDFAQGFNSTDNVDIVKESERETDGGALGFRIIGGNAATGSGTPVSNKGRSGYTEYI